MVNCLLDLDNNHRILARLIFTFTLIRFYAYFTKIGRTNKSCNLNGWITGPRAAQVLSHCRGRGVEPRSFHFVKKKRPILTFELHISEHMMSYDWTGERTRRMKMMRYAIAIALALGLIAGAASWTLQTI